jgi:hypothetical protein
VDMPERATAPNKDSHANFADTDYWSIASCSRNMARTRNDGSRFEAGESPCIGGFPERIALSPSEIGGNSGNWSELSGVSSSNRRDGVMCENIRLITEMRAAILAPSVLISLGEQ